MELYSFQIDSCLQKADILKSEIREILIYHYDEKEVEAFLFCFHELLNNAIEHGNQLDKSKKVFVKVEISGSTTKFTIEDQGEGFNWRERLQRELDIYSFEERGRGIIMTKMMCDDILYNKSGNRVVCIKSFQEN
ncbi:ATP-binding protein [Desulfuribacillus alkaliarsenatis]|uniref:Histidine kinase/HSP90-like ATPase domain-containing protein n=1 Tax=Desulfuribacillus alkaliarsenatis TaxID=766136 RepID=A0A1E5G0Q0_9FIRM|nr:ATP-binding protein [Desulfuribacillus alkaliarsenatis]OEF96289.1 hypothetical protein BHF68_09000 [Desulfuribacillus alkaliarsenatis]